MLVAWAPAKINLFLEVLGKRRDGYHELETLMVTVDLYDTLCFKEDASGAIGCYCEAAWSAGPGPAERQPVLPAGPDNLVIRAAALLRRHTGTTRGVRIGLTKRIPMGAGLGGGSSDAAATLVGLNRLWNLGLPKEQLRSLAAEVGSDVPFFLFGPSAVCRGRGECVEPLRLGCSLHLVLCCPYEGLSTARVFGQCEPAAGGRGTGRLIEALRVGRLDRLGKELFNRLRPAAESLCDQVSAARAAFGRLPFVGHEMSGSGSAYFGLGASRRQARALGARLKDAGTRVYVVRCSA